MRCGIVGPGRSRNGLAPFIATYLERVGARVVAAAGRDAERTARAAAELGARLGHEVRAHVGAEAMFAAERLDVAAIAAPIPAHLGALRAALEAGVHVLCEKPLVASEQTAAVPELLDGFTDADLVVMENCQWPEVLGAILTLWPGAAGGEVRSVAMGLSPGGRGRSMVEDSLSHLLSVVQALAPLGARAEAREVRYELPAGVAPGAATECVLELTLETPASAPVRARLELRQGERQPREAWIEIDGRRAERRIRLPEYAISFEAPDGRSVPVDDPLGSLVYRFAAHVRDRDRERNRAETERIRQRARLYADVVDQWPG